MLLGHRKWFDIKTRLRPEMFTVRAVRLMLARDMNRRASAIENMEKQIPDLPTRGASAEQHFKARAGSIGLDPQLVEEGLFAILGMFVI